MIIYYHCNSDNALLLSFLLTCHPYIHPLSFHEMIFILVVACTVEPPITDPPRSGQPLYNGHARGTD